MTTEKKAIAVIVICLAMMAAGLLLSRSKDAPAKVTRERFANLQTAIEEWSSANGRVPDSLEELGLADEAIRDLVGTVFEYKVTDEGTVTLTSYGADGKPGGLMFRSDTSFTFQVPASAR